MRTDCKGLLSLEMMKLEEKYFKLKKKSKLDNVFIWILLVLNGLNVLSELIS